MKKLFKLFSILLASLVFTAGCAAVNIQKKQVEKTNYCNIEVINKTRTVVVGILCILPSGSEECVYGGIVLHPERVVEEDSSKISSIVLKLKKGTYAFFFATADAVTEEIEKFYRVFDVTGDGKLEFRKKSMSVRAYNEVS